MATGRRTQRQYDGGRGDTLEHCSWGIRTHGSVIAGGCASFADSRFNRPLTSRVASKRDAPASPRMEIIERHGI